MTGAFLGGLVAGLSFVVGGAIAVRRQVDDRVLGPVMGLGVGALISAVAYELVDEAGAVARGSGVVALGLLGGAAAYVAVLEGVGHVHSHLTGREVAAHAATVVPEGLVIVGALLAGHGVEIAVIVAIFLCGVPESMAATARLTARGVAGRRIMGMWVGLAVLCGATALLGYAVLRDARDWVVAVALAAAGGAVLCDLTTDLVPEAYRRAGVRVGIATVAGFALSFGLVELG